MPATVLSSWDALVNKVDKILPLWNLYLGKEAENNQETF